MILKGILGMMVMGVSRVNSAPSNETMPITNDTNFNLTLESRLLAVVLLFTLLVAVSLLVSFYKEVAGKPVEKNMVTGILLVSACSATFTTSNALQKFGHHSCAPWQFLLYRGVIQIASMMLFRCWTLVQQILKNDVKDESSCDSMEIQTKKLTTSSVAKVHVSKPTLKGWIVWYLLGPDVPGARIRVVLQGLCGSLILFGIFTSLHLIPAAEATAIFFMVPIFSFVFSSFMLKEPYTILRMIISVIVIIGVGLVTRPKPIFDLLGDTDDYFDDIDFGYISSTNDPEAIFNYTQNLLIQIMNRTKNEELEVSEDVRTEMALFGYICALIVPAAVSMITILSRQLATISTKTLNVPLLMIWQGYGTILIGLISYAAFNDPEADEDVGLLWWSHAIGVIVFGMMGNIFVTLSTKFLTPSLMNVIRCIEVVFMCFIQLELSESTHDQVFYIEYGLGIVALFLAGGLLCTETWIMKLCSKKSHLSNSVPNLFVSNGDSNGK